MKILDYGCAMGYFSIPLAKMAGPNGIVYCADIQPKMLEKLKKRAEKHKVTDNIKLLEVGNNFNPIELENKLDFVLLFAVVHEVLDKQELFNNIYSMLKDNGVVFFAEPKGHVKINEFKHSLTLAQISGFKKLDSAPIKKSLNAILVKSIAN